MRLSLLAVLALTGACAKEAPEAPVAQMPAAEVEQGLALCDAYLARVCACAERDATFRAQCELARSQPEAARLAVEFLAAKEGPISKRERAEGEDAFRKVVKACVKNDGGLDPAKCPRSR